MSIRNSVKKLPFPIKQGLKYAYGLIPFSIRYGKVFRDTYEFLQKSQWWSREKLEEYQMQQLTKLLTHSYENVPYYRNIFDERGLKPTDIQDFDDLKKLPYLTKEIIRERLPDLIAQNYPQSKLHYTTTGGTTAAPMGMYWEAGFTNPKEWAFVWRQWNWAGLSVGDKRVVLRGDVIKRFKNNKRRLWEYDPVDNALVLSPYDMTEENLHIYGEKINEFGALAIQAYPSNLHILVHFLKSNNLKIENIKCFLTSSEVLYAHQRKFIEEYLGIKIFDHYGNTERSVLIMQCEKGSYHVIPEYGIVELIGQDGRSVSKEGRIGTIISTGFNNYAMPLLRYKTEDLGVYSEDGCPCGRNYPSLKRIEGRLQEFIVTKQGDLISSTCAETAIHDADWKKISQLQFVQEQKGKLLIKVVKNGIYPDNETADYVLGLFKTRFSGIFDLSVKIVDHIPRTVRGKHKFLIQRLPIEFAS